MLQGFKEFIMRGNVIDLAVGVVIGAAFTTLVTSFSDNLINPLLALAGNPDYSGLGFYLNPNNQATFVDFGAILTAAINFLIIAALLYFVFVLPMNKYNEAQKRRQGTDEESIDPTEVDLLSEIRDLLVAERPAAADTQGTNPADPTTPMA